MKYKSYIQLLRPKHYLKNVLVFLPLIFSGELLNAHHLASSIVAFLTFSMVASSVYIINDLRDKDLDALHPTKKSRPLASGDVNSLAAILLLVVLLGTASFLQYFVGFSFINVGLLVFYLSINILYSFGLKNIPIVDVLILSLGFVIRVLYGGSSIGVEVSKWLYLTVLAFSFYLGLGKRRNEIRKVGTITRKVNKHYNQDYLDKNMYVCLGLTIAYYSLWAVDSTQKHKLMFLTIPVIIAIVMAYSLAIESSDSDGDPVSVVLNNRHLLILIVFCGLLMTCLVYV